jgi:cytoskeletal protein RodZ
MESIGSRLRSARESKGITLDQAQRDTRISSRILTALENDRIAEIVSGPVYIKSFIKKYANYLGLNGTDLAESFTGEKPGFKDQISVLSRDTGPGNSRKKNNFMDRRGDHAGTRRKTGRFCRIQDNGIL